MTLVIALLSLPSIPGNSFQVETTVSQTVVRNLEMIKLSLRISQASVLV